MITRHAPRTVTIPSSGALLYGDLNWPIRRGRTHGLMVVAHPNSGSRLNPRNQALAEALNRAGFVTLQTDLLSSSEDEWEASAARVRYDVSLLADRLRAVVERVARLEIEVAALPVGVLATGTAGAAALRTAAALASPAPRLAAATEPEPPLPAHIDAVVCRHGRPDLVTDLWPGLDVPALFLVAEQDHESAELHRRAGVGGGAGPELALVSGAADLVEDPAGVQAAALVASRWLVATLDPEYVPRTRSPQE
jgi:hypothetical protein